MKYPTRIFLSMAILSIICACKGVLRKECKEDFKTENGIILRKVTEDCAPLLSFPEAANKRWVITEEKLWDSIWTPATKPIGYFCDTPKVDFTTESVIAFLHGSAHGIKSIRNVTKDDAAKKIKYSITDFDCNKEKIRTQEWYVSYNMVVVPKIPVDYTVEFEIIEGN